MRRRLHDDRIHYHEDLVLLPTDEEAKQLDPHLNWNAHRVIRDDGLVKTMIAEIRVDDGFNTYILLKPREEDL